MLKKILIGFAYFIILLVAVILARPNDFKVTREAKMSAPPSVIFAQVNDFRKWESWSPWSKIDPNAKSTFEGKTGKGSSLAWDGNKDVGAGKMTILESNPNERILIQIEFFKPFEGTNSIEFTFKPEGKQTLVTWSTWGKSGFMGKAMSLIFDCEKMIGDLYEKGLANLKTIVEKK